MLVAVALALAALASSAQAEPMRFGDIAATPLPVPSPSAESAHGYVEYRFAVENRSADKPHEVGIRLPFETYRDEAPLVAISRSVVVAPGATVVVSVPQCPLALTGSDAAVSVDGRQQRDPLRVNVEAHGVRAYWGSGRMSDVVFILSSRGVAFPTPGEKEKVFVARAEQDVREWSAEWLAYSRYDAVAVTAEEMERMPPPVRLALVRYVECGGTLKVVGAWQPPQEWRWGDGVRFRSGAYNVGFGRCIVTAEASESHTALTYAARESAEAFRNVRSVEEANREFPVVEDIRAPVRGMLVLMLVFVIVIGPVNIIVLGRLNKRLWLLVTVPLVSFLTGALMFGYSALSEGFQGHYKTATLTLLDEATGRATSLGWAAYYSPLSAGAGLRFSYQTELSPQLAEDFHFGIFGGGGHSAGRTVDWTEDQHLASGWLAARVPVHFMVRRSEVRRERLAVRTGAGGKITVVNGLGAPIKQLTLADREGNLHAAGNIPAGAEVALEPCGAKAGSPGILRDFYRGPWLRAIGEMTNSPPRGLRPLTYVAVLDGSPFTDNAMPDARAVNCLAVVYGILGGRADGG
jgi:hypothetical protein